MPGARHAGAVPRIALPEELRGQAFSVRSAREADVGEARLYGRDLDRPSRGVRHDGPVDSLRTLALATGPALPADVAFSHQTAALLLNLPLPRRHETWQPLHVMRNSDLSRIRRRGCEQHKGLEHRRTWTTRGLVVVAGSDTWVDLAPQLDVEDLVVLGDAIARRAGSALPLSATLSRRRRCPERDKLRAALSLIRVGSDSPMETRCRLVFGRAGLPEPELNGRVPFRHDAEFMCRADFVWRKQRVIGEYLGEDHFRSFDRGDDDVSRRRLADDEGWHYVEITKRDYYNSGRGTRSSTGSRATSRYRCSRTPRYRETAEGPSPQLLNRTAGAPYQWARNRPSCRAEPRFRAP